MINTPTAILLHHQKASSESTHKKKSIKAEISSATKAILLIEIAKITKKPTHLLRLKVNENGKKYLASIGNTTYTLNSTPLHFSISHTNKLSVILIDKHPIGCDIETNPRPKTCTALLAKLLEATTWPLDFYLQLKLALTFYGHKKNQTTLALKLWTLAESWCKLHGLKLWQVLKNKNIPPLKNNFDQCYTQEHIIHNQQHYHVLFTQPIEQAILCILTSKYYDKIKFTHKTLDLKA